MHGGRCTVQSMQCKNSILPLATLGRCLNLTSLRPCPQITVCDCFKLPVVLWYAALCLVLWHSTSPHCKLLLQLVLCLDIQGACKTCDIFCRVWYTQRDGSKAACSVLAVDNGMDPPSYTVLFDGTDRTRCVMWRLGLLVQTCCFRLHSTG